jgi:hypothetical protein
LQCALGRTLEACKLIEQNADINGADAEGNTALLDCLVHTKPINMELVRLLVIKYKSSS